MRLKMLLGSLFLMKNYSPYATGMMVGHTAPIHRVCPLKPCAKCIDFHPQTLCLCMKWPKLLKEATFR